LLLAGLKSIKKALAFVCQRFFESGKEWLRRARLAYGAAGKPGMTRCSLV